MTLGPLMIYLVGPTVLPEERDMLAHPLVGGVILFERDGVGEGLVGEVMGLEVAPDRLDVIEFGRVFGSHSTVSQCARAASAASERLLGWIGPLSSTSTTGLACRPVCGP